MRAGSTNWPTDVAAYVFRVRFRVDSSDPDVSLEPATFETVLRKRAAPPGDEGWLFFRDNLWRGEVNDERHLRETASETLGVEVASVSFSELTCDAEYLAALNAEIEANLGLFNAGNAEEVVRNYLGSSVRIDG
ncbi:LWR-salt protein [Halorarius halobius]|uniref:LWR-salt protein n=1 Tax=Halorarius halobius TaxID=2962671 RepID=UPI0020CBD83B|nr:LWR-salt protein [Halorarius halobius]